MRLRKKAGKICGIVFFTIVELLVVIGVIVILAGLLLPALVKSKDKGKSASCMSNLKQLSLANTQYSNDFSTYVSYNPGPMRGNDARWHGVRKDSGSDFDPSKGPLAAYLGESGKVKACPGMQDFASGFEAGCGGYGYNEVGVGSTKYLIGFSWPDPSLATGMKPEKIESPVSTVMFADTAYLDSGVLIEYSSVEAPFSLWSATADKLKTKKPASAYSTATVHFRHGRSANVSWVDGHADSRKRTFSHTSGISTVAELENVSIGNFGPEDNSLYDPWNDNIPES